MFALLLAALLLLVTLLLALLLALLLVGWVTSIRENVLLKEESLSTVTPAWVLLVLPPWGVNP